MLIIENMQFRGRLLKCVVMKPTKLIYKVKRRDDDYIV